MTEERDRWQEIAIRHLWRRLRSHALVVGKFVRAMTAWYEQITTSPPNGQEYKKAAKRFKSMAGVDEAWSCRER